MRPKILNAKGEEIVLNEFEQKRADYNQKIANDLGVDVDITTLTTIVKKVTQQKFFEIAPADYMPVKVGEGAWSSVLSTWREVSSGSDFEEGNVNQGVDSGRLASADAAVDLVQVPVINWAKKSSWNIMDVAQAAKAGNWDLVEARMRARKKNWDLGIQKVAFLGSATNSRVRGLYTQTGVSINETVITAPISGLSTTNFKTFCTQILAAYRNNAEFTAMPTHFIMPELDYLGMAAPTSADFPLKSALAVLLETFQVMTGNPNFKIKPCAYATASKNSLGVQRYILLNYDETSGRMDIPVDFTATMANSLDSFSFQNVAYGQYTGFQMYRPKEMLYFDFDNP